MELLIIVGMYGSLISYTLKVASHTYFFSEKRCLAKSQFTTCQYAPM